VNDRHSLEQLETRLRTAAQHLPYPPTPDLASHMRLSQRRPARRWGWLALAVALVLALVLAAPPLRAAVLRILQIGAVQVVVHEPPATSSGVPSVTANPTLPAENPFLSDLAGETTLAEAQKQLPFPIRLPSYPADLGSPDRVFVQDLAGDALVLVWLDRAAPTNIRMSLHMLTSRVMAEKTIFGSYETTILQETSVAGEPALWVQGPHFLQLKGTASDKYAFRRLVDGNVLIWTSGELTYRLETGGTLEEALRIAESLNN
jgi:hypothetical protein